MVHGQLDIVRAEQARRSGGGDAGLVGTLTQILADDAAPGARDVLNARSVPIYSPEEGGYGNRSHDTLVDDAAVSRVPDLDDEELGELLTRLQEKEAHISSPRRTVLDHLDRLQGELIARYRDGGVNVDDVVASAVSRAEEPRA